MISIFVKSKPVKPRLKRNLFGFLAYIIAMYEETADNWKGFCPICGRPMTKHGTYPRKTPLQFLLNLRIRRVICKACKKTHALLPCFLFPYGRYFASEIELAIDPRANKGLTLEQLAELINTEPCTIGRWRRRFKNHAEDIYHFLAQKLARISLPVAKWLRIDPTELPEDRLLKLIAFLRAEFYKDFPFCNLALINLLFPFGKMMK